MISDPSFATRASTRHPGVFAVGNPTAGQYLGLLCGTVFLTNRLLIP
jgi:hypothetical protein